MQLQFNKSTFSYLATVLQAVKSGEVTQEVRLSDGMPDIGRVLATWGQIILRSKQWQGDLVTLTGGVMTWTLYAPEDGTEPRSVESWIPFQLKWETEQVDREGPVLVTPLLRFADSRSISARKMMVRAGVSALAQGMYKKEAAFYTPAELPEDVQILKNTYPVQLPVEAGEKTFLLDEELPLPWSDREVKLLSCAVSPVVTEKRVLSDKLVMKGNGNLHLVYRDPEGQVHSWDHELSFSQLAELDDVHDADARADVRMGVTSLEADLAEAGKLRLKCGLVAQYLVQERKLLEVVEDAYSPFREVEAEEELLDLPMILEDRREAVTAQQSIPGENGRIADAVFYPDFPRQRKYADGVELELTGLFQTLVSGENGSLQGVNTRWESSIDIPADDSTQTAATAVSAEQVQSAMSADGLLLTSQVQMQLQTTAHQPMRMVTGLELGEEQEPDASRPSLILCRADGASLWQIAKRCGSTVAAISSANGLEGEPVGDRMLLIPVC